MSNGITPDTIIALLRQLPRVGEPFPNKAEWRRLTEYGWFKVDEYLDTVPFADIQLTNTYPPGTVLTNALPEGSEPNPDCAKF